jgi:hypothetical protein
MHELLLAALFRHASNAVIQNQNHNGSCRCYQDAQQIQGLTSIGSEEVEQISAGHCASDAQTYVPEHAFAAPAYNLASEEANNESEKNPA